MLAHPIWAEVDLKAIAHNLRETAKLVAPGVKIMAVVKANAYGHGSVSVAKTALANGASSLAVARLGEALTLREAGFTCPILILGYTPEEQYQELVKHQLIQTVYNLEVAAKLNTVAGQMKQKITVHIKIDTGMGRLGFVPGPETVEHIAQITTMSWLKVEGIYTHFAKADSCDKTYINYQFQQFDALLTELAAQNINFKIRHAANSAAIIDHPETHLDMVRAGIVIYGLYPSKEVQQTKLTLKPAMNLKTTVAQLKKVPAGTAISYGCSYKTEQEDIIATLPLGYADGFSRILTDGQVLIGGRRVPVVGKICMDQCMVNLGAISDVQMGDQVVVFGSQQAEYIPVEEVAKKLNTISYEVLCMLKGRIPRVYIE